METNCDSDHTDDKVQPTNNDIVSSTEGEVDAKPQTPSRNAESPHAEVDAKPIIKHSSKLCGL